MRSSRLPHARFVSTRVTLLAGMGLLHACGSGASTEGSLGGSGDEEEGLQLLPQGSEEDDDVSEEIRPNVEPSPEPDAPPVPIPISPPMSPVAAPPVTNPVGTSSPLPPVATAVPTPTTNVPATPTAMPPPVNMPEPLCSGAEAVVGDGLQQCSNGVVHRVSDTMCSIELPRDRELSPPVVLVDAGVPRTDAGAPPTDPNYDYSGCTSDSDCTDDDYGMCDAYGGGIPEEPGRTACSYGCSSDADCAAGQLCVCSTPAGVCLTADCRTDVDCATGQLCARYAFDDGCGEKVGFACTTPNDACLTEDDCADMGGQCGFDVALQQRVCVGITCEVGRPFLVHDVPRVANTVRRADWTMKTSVESEASTLSVATLPHGTEALSLESLSPEARQSVFQWWRRVAQMEHASVAAFARFSLHLLRFGAPPRLLRDCQRAMADETKHARLAFGLCARFSGDAIGPGPLSLEGAFSATSFEQVVLETVLEGCIGETVAAIEASMSLMGSRDAAVRETLAVVERDELRHAQLAFDFVHWALEQRPELTEAVRDLVLRQTRQAIEGAPVTPEAEGSTSAYGVLSVAEQSAIRADALRHVVWPCIRELCEGIETASGCAPSLSARSRAAVS